MGELIVVEFKERYEADALLYAIEELEKNAVLDIQDSALIFKTPENELDIVHQENLSGQFSISGALYFGFLGAVVGWIISGGHLGTILFALQAGGLLGFIFGSIAAQYSSVGIPGSLIKEVGNALQPGNSVAFIAVRGDLTADRVVEQLRRFQGVVLRTSLPPAQEKILRTALAHAN